MIQFDSESADQVWLQAARFFRTMDRSFQLGRGGNTLETLHAAFSIHDPRQRWVVSRPPAMNPAFAIAEVIWIIAGRSDAAFLNFWNSRLAYFAGADETYHGAYGDRLRKHFGIDQLDRAYKALSRNPTGRQVVLQIWDPECDLPDDDGKPVSPDIPCNICALLKVRDGRLEWLQVLRSNDLFLGVPHNFIQFTCVQEILAGWLGLDVGTYTHISDSLHVYERDFLQLNSIEDVAVQFNSDDLRLPRDVFDAVFEDIEGRLCRMTSGGLSARELEKVVCTGSLPEAYRNLVAIMGAECARRSQWRELAGDIALTCSNRSLMQMWERWLVRVEKRV